MPWTDPAIDRLRAAVRAEPDVVAALPYLRDTGTGPRPALGLVGGEAALRPGSPAVAALLAAVGTVFGHEPAVVALRPEADALRAVLAVAPPVGAGGRLEEDCAAVATARRAGPLDTAAETRATAALVDARLLVLAVEPTPGRPVVRASTIGRAGAPRRLDLALAEGDGRRAVAAFSSELALARAALGGTPEALAGWALVGALPPAVTLVVDPGCPWSWAPRTDLAQVLARRRPAGVAAVARR